MGMAADTHYATGSSTNPPKVPGASYNYSYWVSVRLSATTSPTGAINNEKFYTDGASSLPTGVDIIAQNANAGADAGYRQATGTSGTTGDVLNTTNHTGLTAAPVDIFTFTAGSPKTLTGSITNPSTGDFGDFMVYQFRIASSAGAVGAETTAETFTFQYDES